MHSGRIVFSQSMDDLPHIVVFGLAKLLANRTPETCGFTKSIPEHFYPPLPCQDRPYFLLTGGTARPFDKPCENRHHRCLKGIARAWTGGGSAPATIPGSGRTAASAVRWAAVSW